MTRNKNRRLSSRNINSSDSKGDSALETSDIEMDTQEDPTVQLSSAVETPVKEDTSSSESEPAAEVVSEPTPEPELESAPEVATESLEEHAAIPEATESTKDPIPVIVTESVEENLSQLVNPAQNFTTDANIKAWDVRDPQNVFRGILENIFLEYEKNMLPKKPIDRQKGGQYQTTLYQAIIRVAQSKTYFNENWTYILNKFHENLNHTYDINYLMRFVDAMNVTKADVVLYPRLLNLIIMTCDRQNMVQNLRRVSLEQTLQTVASTTMRANILGYYRQYIA